MLCSRFNAYFNICRGFLVSHSCTASAFITNKKTQVETVAQVEPRGSSGFKSVFPVMAYYFYVGKNTPPLSMVKS